MDLRVQLDVVLKRLGIVGERRGRRLWGEKCPNPEHVERTPSWSIMVDGPKKGSHHCFGCKFGGGVIDLAVMVRDLTRDGAIAWLKEIAEGEGRDPVRGAELVIAPHKGAHGFRLPDDIIFDPLSKWVTPARRYAIEKRRLTEDQVKRWGIGYAVDGALRGRIVLVTYDTGGRPVNYTGRTFLKSVDKRYWNATEKEGPDVSVFYGEHLWAKRRELLIVTEGGFNALAIERAVKKYARELDPCFGGLGGSHVMPMHLASAAGFKSVLIVTDNDAAGHGAAHDLGMSLERHSRVLRATFPEGEDADSFGAKYGDRAVWSVVSSALTSQISTTPAKRRPRSSASSVRRTGA
jgi:Toprim domain/CHC2 zinc finger